MYVGLERRNLCFIIYNYVVLFYSSLYNSKSNKFVSVKLAMNTEYLALRI